MKEHESKDKKRKVTIENTKFTRPNNHASCFVYKCGNVVELVTSANKIETVNISRYRKRKNGEYIDLETRRNQKVFYK